MQQVYMQIITQYVGPWPLFVAVETEKSHCGSDISFEQIGLLLLGRKGTMAIG